MENQQPMPPMSGAKQTERLQAALENAQVRKQGVTHVAQTIEKNLGGVPMFVIGTVTDGEETKPVRWAPAGAAFVSGVRSADYDLVQIENISSAE